jgi:hypothetical protein
VGGPKRPGRPDGAGQSPNLSGRDCSKTRVPREARSGIGSGSARSTSGVRLKVSSTCGGARAGASGGGRWGRWREIGERSWCRWPGGVGRPGERPGARRRARRAQVFRGQSPGLSTSRSGPGPRGSGADACGEEGRTVPGVGGVRGASAVAGEALDTLAVLALDADGGVDATGSGRSREREPSGLAP